jgi:hypothetical protein
MKKVIILSLIFLTGCGTPTQKSTAPLSFKVVGSESGHHTWIYLCGLLSNFIPDKMDELATLDTIGKQLDITFLAMIPKYRCADFDNRLCWPQDNEKELLRTYQEITDSVNQPVEGYIGFSNGGFFLDSITQLVEIKKPIISIGAAGNIFNKTGPKNSISLLIGKDDKWHYEHALKFYELSKDTNLTINLIEYDGGHAIPENLLRNLLKDLRQCHPDEQCKNQQQQQAISLADSGAP